MKKEYMKPEAEMVKFVEEDEIMTGPNTEIGITSFDFDKYNLNAL